MKKKFVSLTLITILCLWGFSGVQNARDDYVGDLETGKQKKLFAGLGFSFSEYEGPVFLFGLEMQFAQQLFAQISIDYYFNPLPDAEDLLGVDYTLLGANLYGVFKFTSSENFNIFIKAGLNMTGLKTKGKFLGVPATSSQTKLGAGMGLGLELMLSEKWGLLFGGTYKILIADSSPNWLKLYGGIIYRI